MEKELLEKLALLGINSSAVLSIAVIEEVNIELSSQRKDVGH